MLVGENCQELRKKNILIVDDLADNVFLLSAFLSNLDVRIDSALSGSEALKKAELNRFDIVILDIQMPHMDGWETARILREQGFTKPIIACSAIGLSENAFSSANQDFSGYIKKPVSRTSLIDYLTKYIQSIENQHSS